MNDGTRDYGVGVAAQQAAHPSIDEAPSAAPTSPEAGRGTEGDGWRRAAFGAGLGLTWRQARVLAALYWRGGRVVSIDTIRREAFGSDYYSPSVVRVAIGELRTILGRGAIGNVRGRGYYITVLGEAQVITALVARHVETRRGFARDGRSSIVHDMEPPSADADDDELTATRPALCGVAIDEEIAELEAGDRRCLHCLRIAYKRGVVVT